VNPGDIGEASFVVGPQHSAKMVRIDAGDDYPDVFGTWSLVALMENAAARAMKGLLGPGRLSVGVHINTSHLAATSIGAKVRAKATFLRQEGKIYHFKVEAFDQGGLIGEGEHARAIVDSERLVNGALSRNQL
jgi:fluoroacetyl-CoA thioesterase